MSPKYHIYSKEKSPICNALQEGKIEVLEQMFEQQYEQNFHMMFDKEQLNHWGQGWEQDKMQKSMSAIARQHKDSVCFLMKHNLISEQDIYWNLCRIIYEQEIELKQLTQQLIYKQDETELQMQELQVQLYQLQQSYNKLANKLEKVESKHGQIVQKHLDLFHLKGTGVDE